MRCPIHREGWIFSSGCFLAAFLARTISRRLSRFMAFLGAFTLYFFRDPEREIPSGAQIIVSPADGHVIGIDQVDYAPFIEGPAKRISIFLSIFDVHINRAPIEGTVGYRHYHPGKFFPANIDKASLDNEQNAIGIEDAGFKVLVKQIAGIVARRIVCWVDNGSKLARGDRFGLIRFGSRTELYMPLSAKIEVQIGQKVQGGATIVGRRS